MAERTGKRSVMALSLGMNVVAAFFLRLPPSSACDTYMITIVNQSIQFIPSLVCIMSLSCPIPTKHPFPEIIRIFGREPGQHPYE